MRQVSAYSWLHSRGVVLAEDFIVALCTLAESLKKKRLPAKHGHCIQKVGCLKSGGILLAE